MNLPKLRTVRVGEVKFGKKTINFTPWSNRDVVMYENARDDIIDKELESGSQMSELRDAVYEYLVKPNLIDFDKELTFIEREVLFIELYKNSRGTLIPIVYKCPIEECNYKSQLNFNITTDFKFTDVDSSVIETKDFKFTLKSSKYIVNKEVEDVLKENVKMYASYIKDITYKNETELVTSVDELAEWLVDELDEDNFKQLMIKLKKALPKISLKTTCTCDKCGHTDEIAFQGLPDFSITPL